MGNDEPYPTLLEKKVDFREYVERIINNLLSHIKKEHLLLGKTKVFMR
jgi:hypothetical protein